MLTDIKKNSPSAHRRQIPSDAAPGIRFPQPEKVISGACIPYQSWALDILLLSRQVSTRQSIRASAETLKYKKMLAPLRQNKVSTQYLAISVAGDDLLASTRVRLSQQLTRVPSSKIMHI